MTNDVTIEYRLLSSTAVGPPNITSSDRGMASRAVIASVSVVSVILATIAITILIFCLYRRRKQARNKPKTDGRRSGKTHGSSTMRSDKSDHPYENPSLPRRLNANLKSSTPANGQNSDPYVTLKGQSLPHQYQWLGNKAQPPDESEYDELVASTEGSTGGYYFKLEPGSRGNTGLRPGLDPTSTTTDPDQAYDLVEVGNMVGKNVNSNINPETSSKDTGDDEDPYYFKFGGSKRGSSTAPASLRLTQQPDGKPPNKETGIKVNRKPTIAAKPNLATHTKGSVEESADYDKLDRSAIRKHDSEDVNANEYNKLLPRLAVSNNTSSGDMPSDGYLKVTLGNGRHCGDDDTDGDQSLMEAIINDYNKLDRGVEKEIDSLAVAVADK